jgi:SET domain-containing protein 6
LILVLIFETRPESPWKAYIDLLPTEFNSLMFWTPDELKELKGSAVLEKIGKEDAETMFLEKLLPVVRENESVFSNTSLAAVPEGVPFETHFLNTAHRMASVILSYSFDLVVPGQEEEENSDDSDEEDEEKAHYKAMVPMADMLNADADRNNCRLFETPTGLEMKTIVPVAAGAELFNDYGPLPRSDLLRRYGYCTPNYAQYDVVELNSRSIVDTAVEQHNIDAEDKQERVDYLLDEGVLDDSYDFEAGSNDIPEEILVVVHTLLLDRAEFEDKKSKGKLPKPKFNEQVGKVLRLVLEDRMRDYPTTIEEDERILADANVQGRIRAAVEVRLGEKQILLAVYNELLRKLQQEENRKRSYAEAELQTEEKGSGARKIKAMKK